LKVYKYRTVDAYSLAGLANSELWFSGLQDFNDPFEGSYKFEEDEFDAQDKSAINLYAPWQGFEGLPNKILMHIWAKMASKTLILGHQLISGYWFSRLILRVC
jgi:hypothetical protein